MSWRAAALRLRRGAGADEREDAASAEGQGARRSRPATGRHAGRRGPAAPRFSSAAESRSR